MYFFESILIILIRFDLMNLTGEWIQRIDDPFLDFNKKRKIFFRIQQSGFRFSPKNAALIHPFWVQSKS